MEGKILIEVSADNAESAIIANRAGAHRIELCSALEMGGLTPSKGLMEYVISHTRIPVNVLIRPRSGDFLYNKAEYDVIKSDIFSAKVAGAAGIVIGMLNSDGTIDTCRMKEVMDMCSPVPVTFHRAFDMSNDPFIALENIIELGCARVLTSGRRQTASAGAALISELVLKASGRIIVMPGAGINIKNFAELVEATGCSEFHLSGSTVSHVKIKYQNEGLSDTFPPFYKISDPAIIEEICKLAAQFSN